MASNSRSITLTKTVTLTRDDQIVIAGEIIGYIENDYVYVFERGNARKIGSIDHRSEVVKIIEEWRNQNV